MNLTFSSFADAGDLSKERLILKAKSDLAIGNYAVFVSGVTADGTATAGKKTAFWFPDGDVKANDLVVLYTKTGIASKKVLKSGATAHFFMGLQNPQWEALGRRGAVILRAVEWTFKPAKGADESV